MSAQGQCAICGGLLKKKLVTPKTELEILKCPNCNLWVLGNPPSAGERKAIYGERYFESWGLSDDGLNTVRSMKRKTFENAFKRVKEYANPGRLLDVGCAFGVSVEVAKDFGWDAYGLEVNPHAVSIAQKSVGSRVKVGDFESALLDARSYEGVLLWDVLEHLSDPLKTLQQANRLLSMNGVMIINTPSTKSLSARLMRGFWHHFKTEHLCYLSPKNLKRALNAAGFELQLLSAGVKALNLRYIHEVMTHYPIPGLTPCVRMIHAITPPRLRRMDVYVKSGDMFVIAKKTKEIADIR